MKYKKKPVVVEAIQWNGANHLLPQTEFMKGSNAFLDRTNNPIGEIVIPTLEGVMRAQPGDYIIKGVKGEFYPCKPDIFEATYELV